MKIVLILIWFIYFCQCKLLPTELKKNREDGNTYYFVNVYIGTPRALYSLYVDFSAKDIILFKDISKISNSYSSKRGGSDFVVLGDQIVRGPISMSTNYNGMSDGILGLNKKSFVWFYWPDLTIMPYYLKFGNIHNDLSMVEYHKTYVIPCLKNNNNSLCNGVAQMGEKEYTFKFNTKSENVLPKEHYQQYMTGKNIFTQSSSSWEPISFKMKTKDAFNTEQQLFIKKLGMSSLLHKKSFDFSINGQNMIPSTFVANKKLLVSETEEDNIIIGLETWKNYIVYFNHRHDLMVLKYRVVQDHFNFINIFLFTFLFVLYVRWRLIHEGRFIMDRSASSEKGRIFLLAGQIAAMLMTIFIYCIPSTRNALESFKGFTIIIGLIIIVLCSLESFSILLIYWGNHKNISFIWNSINSVCYETILFYGAWMSLLERKLDGLESFFTVTINLVIIYSITYNTIIMYSYVYLVSFKNLSKASWLYIFLFLPFLFVFQLVVTYKYFAYPLINLLAPELQSNVKFLMIISGILIVIAFSTYISLLSISKTKHTYLLRKLH
jgi:hypothetical protein